ncbi:MAG TPA: T9SS type A sorting domain-containing protein [Niastella sp.]
MKKISRIIPSCLVVFLLTAYDSLSQNNLLAGDIVFTSYQSDKDLSNTDYTLGTTQFTDRFAILVLKKNGLAAGTVIYFTDNGWNAGTGNFISGLSEGFIKWVVPAGGIAFNTPVYFISSYVDPVMSWGAYSNSEGTNSAGMVTTASGSNYLELSTGGDQVLAYQSGSFYDTAGAYNNANRRFITAINANKETGTTAGAWDGATPAGGHQSSIPSGLTANVNAYLMGAGTEYDNGKLDYSSRNSFVDCKSQLSALSYNNNNWLLRDSAFLLYTITPINTNAIVYVGDVSITTNPSNTVACPAGGVNFSVSGANIINYQWQESTTADFASPVTLSNTGVYKQTSTNTLNISDVTGLSGRFYRAVASNSCGSVPSDTAKLSMGNASLANAATTSTQLASTNLYYNASCALIAKVVPSGASPVTGNVTANVWIENGVPVAAAGPFVARHFEITPATNATTATGTVTLYFTQAEFTAFNNAPGSTLNLPTSSSDTRKSNLRIGKFSGSSNNGSGLPGSYTSSKMVIDPDDSKIVWNNTDARWEITFDVTGFSGFFVQTITGVLPVNLIAFNGRLNNKDTYLQWKTTSETNNDYFDIERSLDGQTFIAAGRVAGNNGSIMQNYTWIDAGAALLNAEKLFYRLKIVSTTGEVEYSNIITVSIKASGSPVVNVTPNPFTNHVKISLEMPVAAPLTITLSDITGKKLRSELVNAPKGASTLPLTGMHNLVQGMYVLSVQYNGQTYTYKLVK